MSQRARAFVDSWIQEYVHPTKYESKDRHPEARAFAVACYNSALIEGIMKVEIAEEYPDLVSHMAKVHESTIDAEVDRLVRKED
ncbi:MAG: hypothetical protein ABJA60_02810 [Nitrosospira sp.]